ncbi:rhomboid family intramembrane serine protease [Anaeromyxobacter diazotrophicus]|uniref:rhomboid family intramembrane serine protease n=1 Tax=Anaeromyxobacter diazotrophicus TaxID=2590199 RepID=UPI001592AF26|nr:rhomboid family intramembrane serine protease [Anaeromyxobacter diazotrophicus]
MPPDAEAPPPPEPRLARLRAAPATSGLLAALAAAFLASLVHPELVQRFAKVDARVRAGEWWRLFTASFLHGGLLHVGVNAYALYAIGPTVERLYGRVRFLLVFLLGGALGFAASTAFVRQPSLGASAGLFALLGVLLGFAVRERRRLDPSSRRAMMREILTVAGLNLGLGLMVPFVDNAAHLGGFAGGLLLGVVLRPRSARRAPAAQLPPPATPRA